MRAEQDDASALLDGLDLDTLLTALTRSRGYEAALRDPPGRRGWSDAVPGSISFLDLDQRIERLSRLLALNKGQPGASVAILAPLGPEAIVSMMAALRAGLSPLMLPLHANELELLKLIEASGAVMALGVSRVGSQRPLMTLRNLAMRTFGTRFVGGFGPDIPDGVAPLDMLMTNPALQPLPPVTQRPALQVTEGVSLQGPFTLSERELLGKALDISRALKPAVSSRIVTTLIGGDLAALASGPAMAMLAGLELLPLGLFSLGDLQACIEGGRSVHLVLPGAMEPALAHSRLASHPALASLVFVQRGAREDPAVGRPDIAIVDIEVSSPADIAVVRRQGPALA
ncbi:AMP-binding protein [Bosea sp. (in: a-proteobacteria)]|uniref:AMP-binding protein n=1 Tax=Bosea sp. (in: a-proteobacteria) TaxID=1871050 RepID=UPI0026066C38|nr:AMP-binding protein [Bosea sp. (in: a-proteobacteria)]MCO5093270.1 AMP-binding protein [Bosea sp. (in: a-proteobacteria)]